MRGVRTGTLGLLLAIFAAACSEPAVAVTSPCTMTLGARNNAATITLIAVDQLDLCNRGQHLAATLAEQALAFCRASSVFNPEFSPRCSFIVDRTFAMVVVERGLAPANLVVCSGSIGTLTYEVRDAGNKVISMLACWYLTWSP